MVPDNNKYLMEIYNSRNYLQLHLQTKIRISKISSPAIHITNTLTKLFSSKLPRTLPMVGVGTRYHIQHITTQQRSNNQSVHRMITYIFHDVLLLIHLHHVYLYL